MNFSFFKLFYGVGHPEIQSNWVINGGVSGGLVLCHSHPHSRVDLRQGVTLSRRWATSQMVVTGMEKAVPACNDSGTNQIQSSQTSQVKGRFSHMSHKVRCPQATWASDQLATNLEGPPNSSGLIMC